MSDTRVKQHPTLGILVCTDGHVMVPQSGTHPAHWTYGSKTNRGYMTVMIAGKNYSVHRLVAEVFIGKIPDGYQIDHINRCPIDNRVGNLRIVTQSENQRNTSANDRVEARGGTHFYDDEKQYKRENCARYYAKNNAKIRKKRTQYYTNNKEKVRERHARYRAENKDKVREQKARYNQAMRKTHRYVRFSDGLCRWVPHAEALELLKLPVKERIFSK